MSELTNIETLEPRSTPGLAPIGLAMAGLAVAAAATAKPAKAVTPAIKFADIPGTGDIKVLNYALALEAFETEVYIQALLRLTGGGRTPFGTSVTGLNSTNQRVIGFTRKFAMVERNHRDFLIGALGAQAITRSIFRRIQVDVGINNRTERQVVELLFDVEATGTGAYLGAIPFFSTKTFLLPAAAIQGTEARHTAIFADIVNDLYDPRVNVSPTAQQNQGRDFVPAENGAGAIPNTPAGTPPHPDNVLLKVSPFIVLLDAPRPPGN